MGLENYSGPGDEDEPYYPEDHYQEDSYEEGGYPLPGQPWHDTAGGYIPPSESEPHDPYNAPVYRQSDLEDFVDDVGDKIDSVVDFFKGLFG